MVNISKARWKAVTKYSMETGKLIKTYPSIAIAAKKNNLLPQSINLCVVGKTKYCGGFLWEYAKNYRHDNQKICCKCREKLTRQNKAKIGFNICGECGKKYKSNRLNNIKEFLLKSYNRQKSIAKKNGKKIPYTPEEFLEWISKQDKFFSMYHTWIKNKQNIKLTPHIARIDPNRPYSLNNTEVISEKQWYRKRGKPVEQWDKKGQKLIHVYSSIIEASITTGVDSSKITAVARNRKSTIKDKTFVNRSGGGFKWKYSKEVKKS